MLQKTRAPRVRTPWLASWTKGDLSWQMYMLNRNRRAVLTELPLRIMFWNTLMGARVTETNYPTQAEAISAAKIRGHQPLVARVRNTDKGNPDHCRGLTTQFRTAGLSPRRPAGSPARRRFSRSRWAVLARAATPRTQSRTRCVLEMYGPHHIAPGCRNPRRGTRRNCEIPVGEGSEQWTS